MKARITFVAEVHPDWLEEYDTSGGVQGGLALEVEKMIQRGPLLGTIVESVELPRAHDRIEPSPMWTERGGI